MRLPWQAIIIGCLILVLVFWRVWATMPRNSRWRRGYMVFAIVYFLWMCWWVLTPKGLGDEQGFSILQWMMHIWIALFVAQSVYALVSLVVQGLAFLARARHPWGAIRIISAGCAVAALAVISWGTLVTRHRLEIKTVDVAIPGLAEAFDGYKIIQLSDLHVDGTGTDTAYVRQIVEECNRLRPDAVMFTGDIVSRRARELEPYADILAGLVTRDGVYSVLGNHDYEDYVSWDTPELKSRSHRHLLYLQRTMGWHLLRDSTSWVHRGVDSLAVIGVENIGDPPFHTYGSLKRAYQSLNDSITKILLSHNPVHWTDSIAGKPGINVALTLSGHTHSMQMKFWSWSPASLRYLTWEGLYRDNHGRQIYVNPGLGTVGYPMRIGTRPQITVLRLRKS